MRGEFGKSHLTAVQFDMFIFQFIYAQEIIDESANFDHRLGPLWKSDSFFGFSCANYLRWWPPDDYFH